MWEVTRKTGDGVLLQSCKSKVKHGTHGHSKSRPVRGTNSRNPSTIAEEVVAAIRETEGRMQETISTKLSRNLLPTFEWDLTEGLTEAETITTRWWIGFSQAKSNSMRRWELWSKQLERGYLRDLELRKNMMRWVTGMVLEELTTLGSQDSGPRGRISWKP